MILSLITQTKMVNLTLPQKAGGCYELSSEEKNEPITLRAEGRDGQWVLLPDHAFCLWEEDRAASFLLLHPPQTVRGSRLDGSLPFTILAEPLTPDRIRFEKYALRDPTHLLAGSGPGCDLLIKKPDVPEKLFILSFADGLWTIRQSDRFVGIFVNGHILGEQEKLSFGDVTEVMGFRLILGKGFLAMNQPDGCIGINEKKLTPLTRPAVLEEKEHVRSKEDYFTRSPRFKREIGPYRLRVDPPPQKQQGNRMPIMLSVGPAMTMGMASAANGIYGLMNGNKMSAVTSGCMLLGTVLWPLLSRGYEKKNTKKREALRKETYRRYLGKIEEQLHRESSRQREILRENCADIRDCERRILQRSRNLWDHTFGQNDFLCVRLGIGDLPLSGEISFPEERFAVEEDELEKEAFSLQKHPRMVPFVPITLSLAENEVVGVIGTFDIIREFAAGLILQIASLYAYDEVKMVFLVGDTDEFSCLRWLPHAASDDKSIRFYVKTAEDDKEVSAYLKEVFSSREQEKERKRDSLPYYILFALDPALSMRSGIVTRVRCAKDRQNFSLLCFAPRLRDLPKECSPVVDLTSRSEGRLYEKDDLSGKATAFCPDIFVTEPTMRRLCLKLSNIPLDLGNGAYVLPKQIGFLQMYGAGRVSHLNAASRWKENDPTKSLAAQVGIDTFGDPLMLDLHEKYDGPHGLIAGMTGSGKSEFLMTLILSLAVNFSPREVAFVLIDYKGGGMAKTFLHLPHTAGIITNLDGASLRRSLTAIESELQRRQKLLDEAGRACGSSNVDIYRYQKMVREGLASEPLQHLLIIADEFAELKTQQPSFMEQLISAARIGRSLGVHLILATQKPSGVVDDQIWSNSRFRVCLKVQDKADSCDMLKRPDAALLQESGRFYLQVGYDELFKMGQSAFSAAPYLPSDFVEEDKDDGIWVQDRIGRVLCSVKREKRAGIGANAPKQIDAVIAYLERTAQEEGAFARPLSHPPLPGKILLDEVKEKYGWKKTDSLNPLIGEYDDPKNQTQNLLTLPFSQEGGAVCYGAAGSGKEDFCEALLYSLITSYEPKEVQIYVLDFAAETLGVFSGAPHVGDVVFSHEAEKVSHLFRLLEEEVQARKRKFCSCGGSIERYNRSAAEKVPYWVVLIANYAAFAELYENAVPSLLKLTREGSPYGIFFLLSATAGSELGFRLQQNFKQIFVLQMTDESDYGALLGKTDGLLPDKFTGRGLVRRERICEFQTACAFFGEDCVGKIAACCQNLRIEAKTFAKKIPVLPKKVDIAYLSAYLSKDSWRLPIGVFVSSLRVCRFDFTSHYLTIALSADESYRSFAAPFARLLKAGGMKVKIFDPSGAAAECGESFRSLGQIQAGIEEVFEEVLMRHNKTKEAQLSGRDAPAYPRMFLVFIGLTQVREMLDDDHKERLSLIFEKGQSAYSLAVLAADCAGLLSSLIYEKWFAAHASGTDGIWIGGGIADQFCIKTNKVTPKMRQEMPPAYGYVVQNGKAEKIKVLWEENQKEEV